jgi:hypothetical protein
MAVSVRMAHAAPLSSDVDGPRELMEAEIDEVAGGNTVTSSWECRPAPKGLESGGPICHPILVFCTDDGEVCGTT